MTLSGMIVVMKRFITLLYLPISFIYLEIVFRISNHLNTSISNIVIICCFNLFVSILLTIIYSLFNSKISKILTGFTLLALGVFYSVQLCLNNLYGFYLQFSLLGLSDQVGAFASGIGDIIYKNGLGIISLLLPFIIYIFVSLKFKDSKLDKHDNLQLIVIASIALFLFCINVFSLNNGFYYNIYKNLNVSQSINNMGILNSLFMDTYKVISGNKGEIVINNNDDEPQEEEPIEVEDIEVEIVYDYNNLDIDFDSAIENSSGRLKTMDEYFASLSGSKQNEYTGYFEDKNLILFMAESFNEIAVSKDLTPTLYSLIHNGFEFTDYYTPTILSTIGGEFMELTGLYADGGVLSTWRSGRDYFPMGLANMFKDKGYTTYAYHDSDYRFQDRNVYLESIGFDNFLGCWNGLDERMSCSIATWPAKDSDMIKVTVDDYINDDKFMVFYASVSGHGDYSFSKQANYSYSIAQIYEQEVRDYYGDSLSDHVLAYVAGQMELDRALEELINQLKENGRYEDTVIVLCGDHYPYFLDFSEMSALAGYERDSQIECNSSNLIIFNPEMEKVVVDKPACTMDVLPTIYNLFGIDYDSRLIIGNDILSTDDGLVITENYSWVTDYGKYYANSRTFEATKPLEGISEEEYVAKINEIVSNKTTLSYYLISQDYYRHIWEYIK